MVLKASQASTPETKPVVTPQSTLKTLNADQTNLALPQSEWLNNLRTICSAVYLMVLKASQASTPETKPVVTPQSTLKTLNADQTNLALPQSEWLNNLRTICSAVYLMVLKASQASTPETKQAVTPQSTLKTLNADQTNLALPQSEWLNNLRTICSAVYLMVLKASQASTPETKTSSDPTEYTQDTQCGPNQPCSASERMAQQSPHYLLSSLFDGSQSITGIYSGNKTSSDPTEYTQDTQCGPNQPCSASERMAQQSPHYLLSSLFDGSQSITGIMFWAVPRIYARPWRLNTPKRCDNLLDWREVEFRLFFGSRRTLQWWQSFETNLPAVSALPPSLRVELRVILCKCQWSSWKSRQKGKRQGTPNYVLEVNREIQIVQTHFKVVLKETRQGFGMRGGFENCLESWIGLALPRATKFTSSHVHLVENRPDTHIYDVSCVCVCTVAYACTKWYILPTSDANVTEPSQYALGIEVKRYRRYRNRHWPLDINRCWIHWMLWGVTLLLVASVATCCFQPRPDFPLLHLWLSR